ALLPGGLRSGACRTVRGAGRRDPSGSPATDGGMTIGARQEVRDDARSIAFLITAIGQGGAETCLVALATGMRERGWRVNVISMRTPTDRAKVADLESAGVAVATLAIDSARSVGGGMVRLRRILRSVAPSVFHTHMVHANLLG